MLFKKYPTKYDFESFSLPHRIQLDSGGLRWTPPDSVPAKINIGPPKLEDWQSGGLRWTPVQLAIRWTPLDCSPPEFTGLHQTPPDSTGLGRTDSHGLALFGHE